MVDHGLSPGVEDRHQPDSRAEVFRVGRNGQERSRGGAKEDAVNNAVVLESQRREVFRHGNNNMVVFDRQNLGASVLEPSGLGQTLALRTVSVSARIVGDDLVRAVIALFDMTAQGRRAAVLDCPHGFELFGRHRSAMSCAIAFAILAEDIGHLQSRFGHFRADAVSERARNPADYAFARRR